MALTFCLGFHIHTHSHINGLHIGIGGTWKFQRHFVGDSENGVSLRREEASIITLPWRLIAHTAFLNAKGRLDRSIEPWMELSRNIEKTKRVSHACVCVICCSNCNSMINMSWAAVTGRMSDSLKSESTFNKSPGHVLAHLSTRNSGFNITL